MARNFVVRTLWLVAACIVLIPALANAQSVFTGTVKDTSGAVMPGVTVEAASPVLIEKVKSAITNENGQYRIVDLRPGTYTLTFTLPGFNTQTREGIELQSNFTATIDIQLSVGTLQESVTVSGASPVVDVQSNVKQQVLSREVLDAVPTAKTIQGLGQLVLGVTLPSRHLARELRTIIRGLPGGVELWVGGAAVAPHHRMISTRGLVLPGFDAYLEQLTRLGTSRVV